MAVYAARAILHGKGHDVWELVVENIRRSLQVEIARPVFHADNDNV